ncbi:hypothetical protein B0J13DRAFT_68001 [Dactylonectria estremocensis]|uniref:Nephrocystin 3-like N-terminal domain-containing protein n=1 Tax=Dactylonectria estremocensis TaxID=1079267 RepID=A0A9P9EL40_9HYPO|nr:hypothetical protein B0J13DRAFT_68001 [Dactylonectria estremocensis]
MLGLINDTGLSVIYQPPTGLPVVDIVIIHGLKGHPYKTWTSKKDLGQQSAAPRLSQTETPDTEKDGKMKFWHRPLSWRSSTKFSTHETSSDRLHLVAADRIKSGDAAAGPALFWPFDLLPQQCPQARVLTYGYDTKITKYMAGGTNKNSILSHSKDFMFALGRERVHGRQLIFVCHSLGGIVTKEMLARSSVSTEPIYKSIVQSTAAVIFLGTPHWGSPELSAVGEKARSILTMMRMETTSAMLDALGLKTTDLERAQESFSRLWQEYDFRVKTFQEGLSLTGVNVGILGSKVVPHLSSLIGDEREHAETLQANHLEMCRFYGLNDPNYLKLAGEIQLIYHSIVELNARQVSKNEDYSPAQPSLDPTHQSLKVRKPENPSGDDLNELEKSCLESLRFPRMNNRHRTIGSPMQDTCIWLFEHHEFERWLNNVSHKDGDNLIWLRGKPGSGKSVLMKEAFRQITLKQRSLGFCTAAFFFNAKGEPLEHSHVGLLRSLLYQLLPHYRQHLPEFCKVWEEKGKAECLADSDLPWEESVLKSLLITIFSDRPAKKAKILIDAVDECDADDYWRLIHFMRELTSPVSKTQGGLSVCMSGRFFPVLHFFIPIIVDDRNGHDIEKYVDQRFEYTIATSGTAWTLPLRKKVLDLSGGVFLWVVLVVDDLIKKWGEGKSLQYLLGRLGVVPQELETMFAEMFTGLDLETKPLTLRLFQWATLATKPLRLHEWHHILAFIKEPPPLSLKAWGNSIEVTGDDEQLERQIKSLSRGLLQVSTMSAAEEQQDKAYEVMSVRAGAGSFDLENGETRVIEVIHESVREFFLKGRGFSILDPLVEPNAVGNGHLSIMKTCLDYLHIDELDTLIVARNLQAQVAQTPVPFPPPGGNQAQIHSHEPHVSVQQDTAEAQSLNGLPQVSIFACRIGFPCATTIPSPVGEQRQEFNQNFTFDSLREMFPQEMTVDVGSWITTTRNVYDQGSSGLHLRESTGCPSITGQSQTLQGYPALLPYATFQLFKHARLAQATGANMTPTMDRLKEASTWMRWVALREDIPVGTGFAECVAMYESLEPGGFELAVSLDDAAYHQISVGRKHNHNTKRNREDSLGEQDHMRSPKRSLPSAPIRPTLWTFSDTPDTPENPSTENPFGDQRTFTFPARRRGSTSVASFSSAASSHSEVIIQL